MCLLSVFLNSAIPSSGAFLSYVCYVNHYMTFWHEGWEALPPTHGLLVYLVYMDRVY